MGAAGSPGLRCPSEAAPGGMASTLCSGLLGAGRGRGVSFPENQTWGPPFSGFSKILRSKDGPAVEERPPAGGVQIPSQSHNGSRQCPQ